MQNLLTKKAAAKCCCWREVRKAHDSTVRAGGCFWGAVWSFLQGCSMVCPWLSSKLSPPRMLCHP